MKVRFSRLAVLKLEKLLAYLEQEWSQKVKIDFIDQLNEKVAVIQKNPNAFPSSRIDKNLIRCVVTKQTSILYEIKEDAVYVLNIIDNRQDEAKIRKEIKDNRMI